MKAITFSEFGASQVLQVNNNVDKPKVLANEVLIKISHTSVNPVDWKIREGHLSGMFPHVFPIIPGWDAAGTIEQIGNAVTEFRVGVEVYAYTRLPEVHQGTYAEYISIPEAFVALKPKNVTFAEAASIPLVGLTAYQAITEIAGVKKGDKVLITGGAGGVGNFAIQIAKLRGAEVYTTASSHNADYLKQLGAHTVFNYHDNSYIKFAKQLVPNGFDVIFDTVGANALEEAMQLAASDARIVSIVEEPNGGCFHFVYPNGSQLKTLAALIEKQEILVPQIEVASVLLAAQKQDESKQRHVRGKLVLKIDL